MSATVNNPLLGDLTGTGTAPTAAQLQANPGGFTPQAQTGTQSPNPLLQGLNPPIGTPAPTQGTIPGSSGAVDPTTGQPSTAPNAVDPFSQLPGDSATVAPNAGTSASPLTWLEELAIRIMLVTVGLVLIAGGFKIAASRGILSGTGLQQIASRVGLPVRRATR
jgi:hypothetical protein